MQGKKKKSTEKKEPKSKNVNIPKLVELMNRKSVKEKIKPKWMELEEKEIENYYNEREKDYEIEEEEDFERENDLPTLREPKIFSVQCRTGSEKETVQQLMNKYLVFESKNMELGIFSTAYTERFPGFIYIEADNESNVRNAVKDFTNLQFKGGNLKIRVIPVKEVPLIYDIADKNIEEVRNCKIVQN